MAARKRTIQLAISVVNLIIVVIVFTSIWPFPNGDFKVDLPSANDVSWSYDDGVVHVSAPFTIDNGGYYDVKQLALEYTVTNYTGFQVSGNRMELGTVRAGDLLSSSIDFPLDLAYLFENDAGWMVFNDDILNFRISVSCYYTMSMVKFDASYRTTVPWDALIKDFGATNATELEFGEPLQIRYWLETSPLLAGLPPAEVNVSLFGNGTLLDSVSQTLALGGYDEGTLSVDVPMTLSLPYEIEYSVQVGLFSVSQRWTL